MDESIINLIWRGLGIAGTLLSIGAMIFAWITSRSKANSSAIDDLRQENRALEGRQTRVESRLDASERGWGEIRDELHDVRSDVNELTRVVSRQTGSIEAMTRSLTTITEYLLNQGKKE